MNKSLHRFNRTQLLAVAVIVVGALFMCRLFYLQVLQHAYYATKAQQEHTSKFMIPASRGLIYAQDGTVNQLVPLVLNEPSYTVYADPRYVDNVPKVVDTLRQIAGGNLVGNIEKALRRKDTEYVLLAQRLSNAQASLLKKAKLAGVGFQQLQQRVYPEGNLAAQLLGFVDADGHGQYGVEQSKNSLLAGKAGMLQAITDVNGIPLSVEQHNVQTPAKNGKNLALTIDRNIQTYAEQALKAGLDKVQAQHGSVLVMDPRTGAVLAMANMPTYDPSQYYNVTDYSVFSNEVVSDPYEAGSVVKALTMATGLNEGAVQQSSTYNNTGSVNIDGFTIHNAVSALGTRSMTEIFKYSLNTGAVYVLQQLGGGAVNKQARSKLFDYFTNHFQFGKLTGIEQTPEVPGTIIAPDTVQGNNVRYANMSFGQGMDVTMIQAASAFCSIINGGLYYQPYLVAGTVDSAGDYTQQTQPHVVRTNTVRPEISAELRTMLRDARKESFPGVDPAGYVIGGKTGTSQIIDPATGEYSDKNAIGTYLGFGGNSKDGPQYVIMVRIMDAKVTGYAGSVAVEPVFADISNWLLHYLKIQPQGGN